MHHLLPPTLQRRICGYLDLQSLLRMRRCSKHYLALITNVLTEDLEDLLGSFVPLPSYLTALLVDRNAFIGGAVAMHFLLRDADLSCIRALTPHLELYVPQEHYDAVIHHMETRQRGRKFDYDPPDDVNFSDWKEDHALQDVVGVETPYGTVHIFCAMGSDALAPIARAWSTLHISYTNGVLLGTGYPQLLFERRGLLGDMASPEADLAMCKAYEALNFDIRLDASAWFKQGLHVGETPCCADLWCCHVQPRRFDHAGALRCKIDVFVDRAKVAGTWVTWRMDIRPCGGSCLMDVGLLENWQVIEIEP